MNEENDEWLRRTLKKMPTGNLIVCLEKMAKNISWYKPDYRTALLRETITRMNTLNNEFRKANQPTKKGGSDEPVR